MPEYINAPNCTVLFSEDDTDHEHDNEGIVLGLSGQISKPAQFFDGGDSSVRYVFWGPLNGQISCQELIFDHTSGTPADPDLNTSDVIPSSGGFSAEVKYGGNTVGSYDVCTRMESGPGIVTMAGNVYYQGTTSIRIWDPDISAS